MWDEIRGVVRVGPSVLVACFLSFVIGGIVATEPDPPHTPAPAPVVTITDRTVRQLARALDRATAPETTVTAPAALVDEATDVLAAVEEGTVAVAPATTTSSTPPPPVTTSTTLPVTTTSAPKQSVDWVGPTPTTWVP